MNPYFPEIKKNFGFGMMRLPMCGEEVDIPETCRRVDAFLDAGTIYAIKGADMWYLETNTTDEASQTNQVTGIFVGIFFVLVSLGGFSTMCKIKRTKPRKK